MIVTTVVLTNAAQAKCFHSQCRSRMYAVTHQILNLNCILSLEPDGDQWNFGKQHQQGPQNSYPISARSLEACQGWKHLDFYINKKPPQRGTESTGDNLPGMEAFRFLDKKKPPQGAQKARETTCQKWKHLDFYINKKPPQAGTESMDARDRSTRDRSI